MSTGIIKGRICVTWAVEVSAPALQISPIPLTSMFAEYLWILFLKIKITLFADIYRTSVVHKTLTSSASQLRRKKQWGIAVHYPVTLFSTLLYARMCVCVWEYYEVSRLSPLYLLHYSWLYFCKGGSCVRWYLENSLSHLPTSFIPSGSGIPL